KNSVALVGSRMTTHYGTEVARRLSYQLGYLGVTVVSGGARGIDSAAHQGALSGKGRTIAVLGTGINMLLPVRRTNVKPLALARFCDEELAKFTHKATARASKNISLWSVHGGHST